jgi:hypothetical protein
LLSSLLLLSQLGTSNGIFSPDSDRISNYFLPDRAETIWLAFANGLLSGIGYSFSLPRQWRYDRRATEGENTPPERNRHEE